jgi:hypothetical protein
MKIVPQSYTKLAKNLQSQLNQIKPNFRKLELQVNLKDPKFGLIHSFYCNDLPRVVSLSEDISVIIEPGPVTTIKVDGVPIDHMHCTTTSELLLSINK